METTKVIFLINNKDEMDDDLFAFFPEEEYTSHPSDLRMSYAHVGQHSACSINYAKESRLATKEEYKELKVELEIVVGYNLEIIKEKVV